MYTIQGADTVCAMYRMVCIYIMHFKSCKQHKAQRAETLCAMHRIESAHTKRFGTKQAGRLDHPSAGSLVIEIDTQRPLTCVSARSLLLAQTAAITHIVVRLLTACVANATEGHFATHVFACLRVHQGGPLAESRAYSVGVSYVCMV